MRSIFISHIFIAFLLLIFRVEAQQPNIVLILADDLGSETLASYGGLTYETPNLDKLASTGVRFTNGYAYPLCTNTRASLITGKYNFRNWKAFGILDPNEKTICHMMKGQGYKTCMAGKWQLQSYDPPDYPGAELRRGKGMKVEDAGFDEYSMWHTGHTEDKGSRYANPVINQNGIWREDTHNAYGPDLFTDFINEFISENRNNPFFVYYPMALPHGPFVPTPDSKVWNEPAKRFDQDKLFFKDMVEYTDKMVGKIIDHLEALHLRENTLIIFYSDNGTHQSITSNRDGESVKGGKGLTIDDGTRVPLILNWPEVLEPKVSDVMVGPVDFVPTLYDVLNKEVPSNQYTDGVSFWPSSDGSEASTRDWVYIDFEPRPGHDKDQFVQKRFVRGKEYKRYADGKFFHIDSDRLETAPIEPETVSQQKLYEDYGKILDSLTRYPEIGELKSFDPQFYEIVSPNARVEVIGSGFTWTEGPVWVPSQQGLLFSDVPNNVIYKWTDMDGMELFLRSSGYTGSEQKRGGKGSNGLALNRNGDLLLCRQGDREIARLKSSFGLPLPVFETLTDEYQGKSFNSPNDLHVDAEGNIYFTDPSFGPQNNTQSKLSFSGVYRLNSDKSLDLLVKELETPNGVALSPDGSTLYIANSRPAKLWSYKISDRLPLKGKVLFDFENMVNHSQSKQRPDGIKVNSDGIIFLAGPDGIHLISGTGNLLGTIYTGKRTSNCAFNEDESILYITCDDLILRIVLWDKPY